MSCPAAKEAAQLAQASAIADEAILRGQAYSALVGLHQHRPDETTPWENIVASNPPLALTRWHATHLRCCADSSPELARSG